MALLARQLPPRTVQRSLALSAAEGIVFALMVGLGETYFLADAIRLSASRLQQGLVIGLPLFAGSLGSLLSLRVLGRLRSRKPLVLGAALAQSLTLLSLAAMDASGRSSPGTLIALASAFAVFGQASGTAWSSWFGDLVPSVRRGRYFALRNRGIYLGTCGGILLAGFLLNHIEEVRPQAAGGSGGGGFALIFALAGAFRLVSVVLNAFAIEPAFAGIPAREHVARFLRTPKGIATRRVLLSSAGFYFMVYLASPYFSPYMLEHLHFSYLEYTFASLSIVAAKVLFLPVWGRLVDQLGPRAIFVSCALLAALVPVPWLWSKGLAWVMVAQAISGLSWAGYELSLFSLVLDRTYRRVRPSVFATQSILNGSAQLLGTVLGAGIAGLFGSDLRWLFAISAAGRLAFTFGLPRFLPRASHEAAVRRREVLLRVIGFRPSGGLLLRPMAAQLDEEPEPPASTPERAR